YLDIYSPPEDFDSGTQRYYAFESGPALFVSVAVFGTDYSPGSPQYQWLERTLASSTQPWKFVFMHWGPYSCSIVHGSNMTVREVLAPLFERYGVDIVFSGHDHDYERSHPVQESGTGATG